ncbi:hypothetical protein HHI36_008000 [Cryptolaemus montrouzieri]|uniref:Endonuclease/exonuclease/phosphatase domain-containing protein n=1 Tax=Cryptolaemus montrouzieri TaxID=559131 RepID=A0ABD2MRF9_9CUCU
MASSPFLYGSDHYPIMISDTSNTYETISIEKWKLKEANWFMYQKKLVEGISSLDTTENIDTTVANFTKLLTEAGSYLLESAQNTNPKGLSSWWSEQCKLAIKKYKHALYKYKRINHKKR